MVRPLCSRRACSSWPWRSLMAEPARGAQLLGWALGTMHTGLFVLAIVVPVYRAGGLDDVLGGLNSLLGLGLYGVLWAVTWWSTTRAVAGIDWHHLTAGDSGDLVLR